MRRLVIKSILAGGVLSLTATSLVLAVSDADSSTSNSGDVKTTSLITLEQRLKERQSRLKTKLDDLTRKRLIAKCGPAQPALIKVKARSLKDGENRSKAYSGLIKRLGTIITLLEKQGINTTELKSLKSQLETAIAQYDKNAESHRTALGDIVTMRCAADPAGFQATLETIREQRPQLGKDAVAVKNLLAELKQALASAKKALADVKSSQNGGNN